MGLNRTIANTFNFLRWRRVSNSEVSDLPVCDFDEISLTFSAPTNLTTELEGINDIRLNWNDNSPDETSFQIERSLTSGSGFSLIATVASGVTTYLDTSLSANTYYYRVRAIKGTQQSGYSNEASQVVDLAFVSTWDTSNPGTSNSDQIKLPLISTGSYNLTVDWGDGNQDVIKVYNQSEVTHTYSSSGVYQVSIIGLLDGWQFTSSEDPEKILSISSFGDFIIANESAFSGCLNLDITATDIPLISTTSIFRTFLNCENLVFNSSIDSWDVSGVVNADRIFEGCTLFNQNINSWVTDSFESMQGTFFKASNFNQPLNNWNVENVDDFVGCFNQSSFNQNINDWVLNTTSNINMNGMFSNTPFNQPLDNWDTQRVTNMQGMFSGNTVFNQPLNNWNVSSVSNMQQMFSGSISFNQPLNNWNVSSVVNYRNMFNGTNFNSSIFNIVSTPFNVVMDDMFRGNSVFNQNISNWNMTNVIDIDNMFINAISFNQDLGAWVITNLTSANNMLDNTALSTANLDSLLNSWASQAPNIQNNVVFGASSTARSAASNAAVTLLTNAPYNWTISTL